MTTEERFTKYGQPPRTDAEFERWLDADPGRRQQWQARERRIREEREAISAIEGELRSKHPEFDDHEIYARARAEFAATKTAQLSRDDRVQATRCPSVELRSAPAGKKVWVHVAYTGSFAGYAGGERSFELTEEIFAQCIANLRASPQFKRGEGVIPFDWNHASEMSPSDLGQLGAPAIGWVYDLRTQPGKDGRTDLYALVEWLPLAAKYISDGSYKWSSISIVFSGVDPVSGRDVGAFLSSIAATNSPFLTDLETLRVAASRNAHPKETKVTIDFDDYDGRNRHEKAHAYLRANTPGFDKLSREEQWKAAFALSKGQAKLDATASTYLNPSARFDEFEAKARSMFSDLTPEELYNVAAEIARSAQYGAAASREGKDWDRVWVGTGGWDLYREQSLPQALPERHRSRVGALEREMRRAFDAEFAAVEALKSQGYVAPQPKTASRAPDLDGYRGRNRHERAMSYLEIHEPNFSALSRDEKWARAFELSKAGAVSAHVVETRAPTDDRPALDVSLARGRNVLEKVVCALERRDGESFRRLDWDEKFRIATQVRRTHRVIGG